MTARADFGRQGCGRDMPGNPQWMAPMKATTDGLAERWHRCKASIGQRIGPEDAATWLPGLQLREVQPHRVVLGGIPNSFFKNRIVSRFRPLILESLRDSFPDIGFASEPVLELQMAANGAPDAAAGAERAGSAPGARGPAGAEGRAGNGGAHAPAPSAGDEAAALPAEARQSFATFVLAEGNASALRFAEQVVDEPGQRYNPLVLVGQTGLGKTHLLQAIAGALRERYGLTQVLYVTGEAFKNEVLDGITHKRMPALRERYRAAEALLLDDLEFLLISPKAQEELLHTFDVLHRAGHQLVLAADRFPRELPGMSDALRSRVEMGLIAELTPPDAPARLALVQQRARSAGLALPAEVAALLAERITGSLRRLEGAVVRLGAYAALHGQPITLDFAQRVAAPFFDAQRNGASLPVSREAILERVADRFGITVRALKGRGRSPNLAGARRIAVHLLKILGEASYSEIGALLGNRSHSTMVHAHQTLQADMGRESAVQLTVQQLARELGEP
jgi:chromosomal replication initiator protein